MVEDAFFNRFFIVDVIITNDDSIMQAVLKYPSIGVRGHFLKSPKVNLDEEIPELSFLAYTPHHVKVVDKHIFSIVKKVGPINVGAPNQMLSDSRNIGGT